MISGISVKHWYHTGEVIATEITVARELLNVGVHTGDTTWWHRTVHRGPVTRQAMYDTVAESCKKCQGGYIMQDGLCARHRAVKGLMVLMTPSDGDFWDPMAKNGMMKQKRLNIRLWPTRGFEGSFRNEMSAVLLADAFATSWDVKKCMSSMAKKQVLWVARHLLITSGMIDLRTPPDKRGAGCRCISPFFHIPSSARSFQKRYSFSLARKIGSGNFGLIQSDPILLVFPDTSLRCGVRRHSGLGHQGRCHLRQCFLARKDWLVWLEGCWPTKICFFFSMFQQATTKHGANIFRFTRENIGGI